MKPIVTAALCASILVGCASSPDRISAAYVSPIQYSAHISQMAHALGDFLVDI